MVTWDEPKRLANIERHGLDFADFEGGFSWDDHVVLPTYPSRTGRAREQLIGLLGGELLVSAIISPLGSEAASLVSLRPASRQERALHELRR